MTIGMNGEMYCPIIVSGILKISVKMKKDQSKIQSKASSFTPTIYRVGKNNRYEIHHINPISQGGAVYDLDNMSITTPKHHIDIHRGN